MLGVKNVKKDVEQRDQELQFSLPDEDHPEHQSSRRQQRAGDLQP